MTEPTASPVRLFIDKYISAQLEFRVRLFNIHLESYKLGKEERQFMKEISEGLKSDNCSDGIKNLTSRLINANKNRAYQGGRIHKLIQSCPYKVIVCGDFNDTPLSYTYRKIKQGLNDSFSEKGLGLGNTYIGEFPSFRIDYILHSPEFETINYTKPDIKLSDHYPIMSKLKLNVEK